MTSTALAAIATPSTSLGKLVSAYIDRSSDDQSDSWLESWFGSTIEAIRSSLSSGDEPELAVAPLNYSASDAVADPLSKVRLRSIRPHFFRGFRKAAEFVDLTGALVVIEGSNSSGKTSLAESIEWLLTGQLERRASGVGNARELANTIGNVFRPVGERTRVEALVEVDGVVVAVERVLLTDYDATQSSTATSEFRVDNAVLTPEEERSRIRSWFGNALPLLMQHNLRHFIYAAPAGRRRYFESLLHVADLTELIEKAVVGDVRLASWKNPSSQGALAGFESLRALVAHPFSPSILSSTTEVSRTSLVSRIEQSLVQVTAAEFSPIVSLTDTPSKVIEALESAQRAEREAKLPALTPMRPLGEPREIVDHVRKVESGLKELKNAQEEFIKISGAAQNISEAQIIISNALASLEEASIIQVTLDIQECPLCAQTPMGLTQARLEEIRGWKPLSRTYQLARNRVETAKTRLREISETGKILPARMIPAPPATDDFKGMVEASSPTIAGALERLIEVGQARTAISEWESIVAAIDRALATTDNDGALSGLDAESIANAATSLAEAAEAYQRAFAVLEGEVSTIAKEQKSYLLRERLLELLLHPTRLADDLLYEQAKSMAQSHLAECRKALMAYRSLLVESSRDSFNVEMLTTWQLLRKDRASYFSRLHIPLPKGKGFPLEIEVKAELDDGTQQKEVDALRVFSESQANVVGIAAFVARSKLLGHGMMILDDPVQSMDEEHFGTLSRNLLPSLLANGIQVIILTHNDTFAREVGFSHIDREDYVTLSMRGSRKKGCCLEDGNRRVAERLKRAEKQGEDGDLQEAWVTVRRAIERMYGCVLVKHADPPIQPAQFANMAAEDMWNSGVEEVIKKDLPECCDRLSQILKETAGGAHDKGPKGATELLDAIGFLRGMLNPLRLGSG